MLHPCYGLYDDTDAGGIHGARQFFHFSLVEVLVGITDAHFQASLEFGLLLDVFHHGTATGQHDAGNELIISFGLLDFIFHQFKDFLQTCLNDVG